jgi:imidazole glycerol-phosphate synthase subunit HisF
MKRARVIPVLLLKNKGLYKTIRFKNEVYVGDPVNAVKIFNDKLCDELIFLDITASKQQKQIDYKFIEEIASECFMPFSYGGGINDIHQIEELLKLGIEKVVLNTVLFRNPLFVKQAVKEFGSSTIVASVDIKKDFLGKYQLYSHSKYNIRGLQMMTFLMQIEEAGVGEIMITSVDNDGTFNGYDLNLANIIAEQFAVPVVFCGGCRDIIDIKTLLNTTQVSAAAAGSLFVFQGPLRGILISYPEPEQISSLSVRI